MRNALCCVGVFAVAACGFAQSSGSGGGIQGIIRDESGQGQAGAYVIASPARPGKTLMARSGANGAYSLAQAPPGDYRICVQFHQSVQPPSPSSKPPVYYVDTCYWSDPAPVTVASGQVTANVNVQVAKAAILRVRLNDPGKFLANEGSRVLVGVVGPSSHWRPLHLASSDASGRTFELAIPFNTAFRLELNSGGLRVADAGGAALAAVTTSFPILQAVGRPDPSLTFNVTGKRP